MKKVAIFVIGAVLFALCLPAFAAQFPDVPTDHWAYAAVQDLSDKGIVIGYPDGTFGGKRALTRYEFAQAISRMIPEIAKLAGAAGVAGPAGPQGPAGPAGPAGISPEQLANIQKLIDEFRDELAAQGVDIAALKKDVAALQARVAAVEAEQARVKITAEVPLAWRGAINNSGAAFDRDSRSLGATSNPLQDNIWFNDIDLSIKGKVSNSTSVTALISAGNYNSYAVGSTSGIFETAQFFGSDAEQFNLWNLYMSSAMSLGPLGNAQVTVGRFPFQLTPLTLKFVNPDSYFYNTKLQNGDYVFDGGSLGLKLGPANLTVFAADTVKTLGLEQPAFQFSPFGFGSFGLGIDQLAGARAVIGTPFAGTLGLTYYQAGPGRGQMQVYGADLKATVAKIGLSGEFAQTKPNDTLQAAAGLPDDNNSAWNANLSYQLGKLGIGGGYSEVEEFYVAPGYWSRLGRATNLQNVKGWNANISYPITSKLVLSADGSFLEPKTDSFVVGRTAIDQGIVMGSGNVDKITGWKAGVKYGITAANAIDLGWEEVQWKAVAGGETKERYYTIGLGHTFSPNASLKLLYQIVDYKLGAVNPYALTNGSSYRGGVTGAEFLLKY